MNNVLFHPKLIRALQIFLGIVFLLAGGMKLLAPWDLVKAMRIYDLVPEIFLPGLAIGLPIFEIVTGLFLMVGYRVGALGASFLLIIFLVALVSALYRGIAVECSCFGSINFLGKTAQAMVVRNSLFLVIALLCYWANLKKVIFESN
jgi:hypothetical protein